MNTDDEKQHISMIIKGAQGDDMMKKYLRRPNYESNDIYDIQATESVDVGVDDVSIDDIMDAPDDTYFSCDNIEEFHELLKKAGLY